MGKMAMQYSSSSTDLSSCCIAQRASCESSMTDRMVTSFSVMSLNSPLPWRMHDTLRHDVCDDFRSRVDGRLTMARGDGATPLSQSITFPTLMIVASFILATEVRRCCLISCRSVALVGVVLVAAAAADARPLA